MVTICGRNSDDMFFLTRDGDVEVTFVEFLHCGRGGLYWYARQYILSNSKEEFDEFGRNYTDRLFIRFCAAVFDIVGWDENSSFKLLSCKKNGNQFIARLELTEVTLEMELSEMVTYLEKGLAEKDWYSKPHLIAKQK